MSHKATSVTSGRGGRDSCTDHTFMGGDSEMQEKEDGECTGNGKERVESGRNREKYTTFHNVLQSKKCKRLEQKRGWN